MNIYKKSIIEKVKCINNLGYLKLIDRYVSYFYRKKPAK